MQVLSAAEAISPAINRTKRFLFEPFRWGTFLKLCLVAILTEGFSGNFNFSGGHHGSSGSPASAPSQTISYSPAALAHWIPVIAAIVLVALALGVVIFYIITRLRFALFHCLVYQIKEIRPGWRLYQEQSWRFFLLCIVVGFVFVIAVTLIAVPFILGFVHLFHTAQPGKSFDFAGFFSLFLPLIPVIFLVVLTAIAIDVILRDLMLPHMALENASVAAAWRAVRVRIAAEKGGFLLYAFLRIVLPLAAMIGAVIILAIPMIIVFGTMGLSIAGLDGLVKDAWGLHRFFLILFEALLVLAGAVIAIFLGLCVGGPIGIYMRNYALLFYGGRYQALGDLLFPSPPPPRIESTPVPA